MDKNIRFQDFNISPETLRAIEEMGFEEPTPIQVSAIPALLEGRDVTGQAQTGTGKTAAFGIPAIERIDPRSRKTQVLVLSPTRELAIQIAEEFARLAACHDGISILPIYGGQPIERQFRALERGAQIVVGTPGRILDHL
ncbi:MAG TPA: DEAD/DEAH box helicase, partial [Methanoculleus sp.]|nr:DEAD/DEAH box helicase [Methanoculleus sp.]